MIMDSLLLSWHAASWDLDESRGGDRLDDAIPDEQDHPHDEADDREQHLLGGSFGLGFDGGGLMGSDRVGFGGQGGSDPGAVIAGEVGGGSEFSQLFDTEFLSQAVESLPGSQPGEAGSVKSAADLGEGPAVAGFCGGVKSGLESAAAGQDDRDQVEVGRQGVAKRSTMSLDPVSQAEVGVEEPGHRQPGRG